MGRLQQHPDSVVRSRATSMIWRTQFCQSHSSSMCTCKQVITTYSPVCRWIFEIHGTSDSQTRRQENEIGTLGATVGITCWYLFVSIVIPRKVIEVCGAKADIWGTIITVSPLPKLCRTLFQNRFTLKTLDTCSNLLYVKMQANLAIYHTHQNRSRIK